MAKLVLIIAAALTLIAARPAFAQPAADSGVTIISPPTAGITIGPGLEIILPPLRTPTAPQVVTPPPVQPVTAPAPTIPVVPRPPPLPAALVAQSRVSIPSPAPTYAPAYAQPAPLPPPAPEPSELQASSSGTRYVEQFDVDGTWTGEVLVNGTEVLRRSAPIRGTEMPRVRVDPAPASMVGGQPGQIRIQVICRIPGRPPQRAPARWVWPNTVYRVSGTQCGW